MEVIAFDSADFRPITVYDSRGAGLMRLARSGDDLSVVAITLEPGGVLGRHPATADQLLVVIAGSGLVSGADAQPEPIAAGSAALWSAGELHETRAGPTGLLAVVIEGALALTATDQDASTTPPAR